jgi:hypothetical protein
MDEEFKHKVKKILSSSLDWEYIKKNALRHRILPLLYYNLRGMDNGNIPKEVIEELDKLYRQTVERNAHLYDELGRVLEAFEAAGIKVIILKGAALAKIVYPEMGLRMFHDIDILIRREDLPRVKKEMVELGYEEHREDLKSFDEKFEYETGYYNPEKKTYLDVHWNIASWRSPFKIDIDAMWGNARDAKIGNTNVLILSPEDMLLFHSVHFFAKHGDATYVKLLCFCDILEIVRVYRGHINWDYISENARKYGIKTPVYYALYYARKLLGASIPSSVMDELKPSYFRVKLFGLFFDKESLLHPKSKKKTAGFLIGFLMASGIISGLKFLINRISPPVEWLSYKYSLPKSKKLYFTHLCHLGFRGIKLFMLLLRRPSE